MKKYIIVIFLAMVSFNVFCQQVTVGYEQGLGLYAMDDLKELNERLLEQLAFDGQVSEDFPAYWHFKPYVKVTLDSVWEIGVNYRYQSTGSRVSYSDYSGSYQFDQLLKAHSFALTFGYKLLSKDKFCVAVGTDMGVSLTALDFEENLVLDNEEYQDESYSFTGASLFIEPNAVLSVPIIHQLALSLHLGYYLQLYSDKMSFVDNDEAYLQQINTDKPINPNWSGLRCGLSASYTF